MPTSDYLPTVQQVADLITSRTKDKYGNEVGTFTANTRPQDSQVTRIIGECADQVSTVIGDDIPDVLFVDANNLVALLAACQIELSFFPEQVNSNRSPYREMIALYNENIQTLAKEVSSVEEGGDPGSGTTFPTLRAVGAFPDPDKYPPYGLSTNW